MSSSQVSQLSPEQRLALIGELWDSLDDADVAVTPAQRAELDRRLTALQEAPDGGVAWETLRDELMRRYR